MTKIALKSLMLATSLATLSATASAQAPAPTPATPPAAAPTTTPTAPATQAPATPTAGTTPPATQGTSGQAGPPANGSSQLPQVEIIQEAPKPKAAEPALKAAPKPKAAAAPAPKAAPKQATAPAPKAQPAPQPAPAAPEPTPEPVAAAPTTTTSEGQTAPDLVRMSPVAGSEIELSKVPGSVSGVSQAAIANQASPNTTDALQARVPGVIVNDVSGNAFQQDVQYHGFSASSINGTPQGLAVYQNGVRINEVWGDAVNWDMIPSVAISDITVVTNNPAFGLNAVGGAVSIVMKDGFNFHGVELDGRGGSFGRGQGSLQWGLQQGAVASYLALDGAYDAGWRDKSASTVRRMYADLGFKGSAVEAHLAFTGAMNKFGASATAPIELLNERWANVFTTPQVTSNELNLLTFNGAVKATDTLKISGTAYWRGFRQHRTDGNISDATECDPGDPAIAGFLCFDDDDNPLNGATIPFDATAFYGSIDRTSITSDSFGGSLQAVEKAKLFGFGSQFLIGGSIDHGKVRSKASSELGTIDNDLVVNGLGIILSDAGGTDAVDAIKPIDLGVTTNYYGLYFSEALDVTDRLTVTVGGRYNYAEIELQDRTGNAPELAGKHSYQRFNPMAGATFKLLPGLTVYGGYSEANRAPTPSELACADPQRPCILESFLVADPELKQVVSHTYEAGLRGNSDLFGGRLDWSVGYFHTENVDDIISVSSATQGRGYFQNAGTTLRQGVDVALGYRTGWYTVNASYSYTDATFETPLELFSPNNAGRQFCTGADPLVDDPQCIFVQKGDKIPSIPAHKFKLGGDVYLTSKLKVGGDLLVTSGQYLRGDEINVMGMLPGYQVVNLRTSYDITSNMQVYGLFNNVFDKRYYNFGTLFDPGDVTNRTLSDPRTVSPGAPFSAYGGVKIKF